LGGQSVGIAKVAGTVSAKELGSLLALGVEKGYPK